jgi:hypothetical protein
MRRKMSKALIWEVLQIPTIQIDSLKTEEVQIAEIVHQECKEQRIQGPYLRSRQVHLEKENNEYVIAFC